MFLKNLFPFATSKVPGSSQGLPGFYTTHYTASQPRRQWSAFFYQNLHLWVKQ